MKRKKKRMSALTRVLLCSWCVLGLVSAVFLIKWAMSLTPETPESSVGSFAQSGNGDEIEQPGGEETKTPKPTVTSEPTPMPVPPKAEFTKEYPHMGMMTELYAYTDGVAYGFRYPCYEASASGGEAVSDAIEDAAHQLVAEKISELAKAEGKEKFLLIDYEDGESAGLYSVLFYIEKELDGVKTAETSCWIYNKKKGETVDPETLFGDPAYLYVGQQINSMLAEKSEVQDEPEEAVTGVVDDTECYRFTGVRAEFPAYLLTADGVKFYYDGDDPEGFIVIPYIAVHTYMAVTENGTVRADNIRKLDPDKPMIALTFDDGPHYQNTPHLLEILEQYNVKSTFFVLGDRSHFSASNKKTVTMVAEAGHEIASHTYSHKDLKTLSQEALIGEVVKARDNLYALTGEYPTYIRPPYGGYNDLVKEYAYAPLINWDMDSKDWSFRDADKIVEHVLKEAEDGNIVLMHDIHWFTVAAVERILPELAARGYQFVTVSELFYYNDVEPVNGTVYYGGYE